MRRGILRGDSPRLGEVEENVTEYDMKVRRVLRDNLVMRHLASKKRQPVECVLHKGDPIIGILKAYDFIGLWVEIEGQDGKEHFINMHKVVRISTMPLD